MKKILLLLLAVLFTYLLHAQTWDDSASTDWNTAANWSIDINTGSSLNCRCP